MSILSILKVLLTAENTEFKQKMEESKKKSADFTRELKKQAQQLLGGAIGIGLVTKGLGTLIREAAEAERTDARLNAVLKSTEGVAGMTAEELDELATSTSRLTGVNDDLIKNAETMLLTFTRIGEDVFPQAMMAALDMSEVIGQDLQSSIVQLGKALNDPIEGVTALRRVGVSFTKEQQEQIKTLVEAGDVLAAQNLILKELQVEFGGAAKAAGETFSGSLDKAKLAARELAEVLGGELLDSLGDNTVTITDWINTATDQRETLNDLTKAYELGIISQEEYDHWTWKLAGGLKALTGDQTDVFLAQEFLNDKQEAFFGILNAGTAPQDDYHERLVEQKSATDEAAGSTDILGGAIQGLVADYDAAKNAAGLLNSTLKTISEDMIEQERIKLVLKLATEDLTKAEMEDLLNQQTTLENMAKLQQALEEDIITKYDWISVMSDGIITQQEMNNLLGEAVGALAMIKDGVVALPEYKKFVYEVEVIGDQIPASPGKGVAPIAQEFGGDWMVRKPTLFLAGEKGPERAIFIPQGQGGQALGANVSVVQYFYGDVSASQVKRASREGVLEAARARGLA